jgi:hypothetical protein
MKKSNLLFAVVLSLAAFLLSSCSSDKKEGSVTIYDGKSQWSDWTCNSAFGETEEGDLALWHVFFHTEIDNSYRTITLTMLTSKPGTYSGVYDENSGKWSNEVIGSVQLTIDYDGQTYPEWLGKTATVTIHEYDKEKRELSATVEAEVVKKGTSETRNIKVEMDHLHFVSEE